jgi:hypothetical protein
MASTEISTLTERSYVAVVTNSVYTFVDVGCILDLGSLVLMKVYKFFLLFAILLAAADHLPEDGSRSKFESITYLIHPRP